MTTPQEEPNLCLKHHQVAVYHCYDDLDELSWYWYTTDPDDNNPDAPLPDTQQFDVRELPFIGLDTDVWSNHEAIIRHAIETGVIPGQPAVTPTSDPVVIEVQGGAASVISKPPGVEVRIIDRDAQTVGDEQPSDPCEPGDDQPGLETLMGWEWEGGCEAIDGCWVEPDGVCEHGCPSWLLELGLI